MAHQQRMLSKLRSSNQQHSFDLKNELTKTRDEELFPEFKMKQSIEIRLPQRGDWNEESKDDHKESDSGYGSVVYKDCVYIYDSKGNILSVSINNGKQSKQLSLIHRMPHINQNQSNIFRGVENGEGYKIIKGRMINNEMFILCEYGSSTGDNKVNDSDNSKVNDNNKRANNTIHEYRLVGYNILSGQTIVQRLPQQFQGMREVAPSRVIFESLSNMYLVLIVVGDTRYDSEMVNEVNQLNEHNIDNQLSRQINPNNKNQANNNSYQSIPNYTNNNPSSSSYSHNHTHSSANFKAWLKIFGQWRELRVTSPQTITINGHQCLSTTVQKHDYMFVTGANHPKLYVAKAHINKQQTHSINILQEQVQYQNQLNMEQSSHQQHRINNNTNMALYQMTIDQITLSLSIQLIAQNHFNLTHSIIELFNSHSLLFLQDNCHHQSTDKDIKDSKTKHQHILKGYMFHLQRKSWTKVKFTQYNFPHSSKDHTLPHSLKDNALSNNTKHQSITIHSMHFINQNSLIIIYSEKSLLISLCQLTTCPKVGQSLTSFKVNHSLNQPIRQSSWSLNKKLAQQVNLCKSLPLSLTTNLLHSSTYSIKFPFHAVLKIIQFMEEQFMSSIIRITSQTTTNTINKYMYISFHFDFNINSGINVNSTKDNNSTINNSNKQHSYQYRTSNLLLKHYQKLFAYSLRLGKTILLVQNITHQYQCEYNNVNTPHRNILHGNKVNSNSGTWDSGLRKGRRVTLISADSRFSPMLQHKPIFYTYCQFEGDEYTVTEEHPLHRDKRMIRRILETLVQDPNQILFTNLSNSKQFNSNFEKTNTSMQPEKNKTLNPQNSNSSNTQISQWIGGGNKLLIFSPNIIPTSKNYFYELVFDSTSDVGLFKNNKKLQIIEKLGYPIAQTMECSLMAFLKWRYCPFNIYNGSTDIKMNTSRNSEQSHENNGNSIDVIDSNENNRSLRTSYNKQIVNKFPISKPKIINPKQPQNSQQAYNLQQTHMQQYRPKSLAKIYLSCSTQSIIYQNESTYLHYLQTHSFLDHITPLVVPPIVYTKSVHLYLCKKDYLLEQNNGVLIYSREGKLVNRYQCQFGELLLEKFYSKKFIKTQNIPHNLFPILGLIHLTQQIHTISFGTEIKKDRNYLKLITELEKHIHNALLKYQSNQVTISSTPDSKTPILTLDNIHATKQKHLQQRKYRKQQKQICKNNYFYQVQKNISIKQVEKDMCIEQVQRKMPISKQGQQGKASFQNNNRPQLQQTYQYLQSNAINLNEIDNINIKSSQLERNLPTNLFNAIHPHENQSYNQN